MRKICMLSFSNIRKTKGNTVSLFIMFFIAALLINAGLLLFINFGSYFDKMSNELNTSNVFYIISSDLYDDEVDQYIRTHENVMDMQKEDAMWVMGESLYKEDVRQDIFLFANASSNREMSKWKFVGKHLEPEAMSAYLPNRYHQDGGYNLNDTFKITTKENTFTFTIKGFIEDTFFCSTETGTVGIYLPQETYETVANQLDDKFNATLVYANLKEINKTVETGIKKLTNADNLITSFSSVENGNTMFSLDLSLVKTVRVMMASMVSLMIVTFAIVIIAVCLIVIRFRIGNSIEDDMTNIGALKAMGYTSKQIKLSIVLQFAFIAIIGSIVGIGLSYTTIPVLSNLFAQQSGIKWEQGFDLIISSIALSVILLIVILVSYITSRRINKLHPIIALRGGIITHSFRKNYLPLSTTVGRLPVVLAFKSIFQNMKQSVMMVIILIAVTFAGTFAVVMYYNTAIDSRTFLETPGIELSNITIVLNTENGNNELINEIKAMKEVRKVQFIDQVTVLIDDSEVISFVMDDYSKRETNTIYEGRYPIHRNEVALSGHVANLFNKEIGDTIHISYGDNEQELLITGLTQGAFMSGTSISLIKETVSSLHPDFKQQDLQIYLNKGISTENTVEKLENLYGEGVVSIVNADKAMEMGAGGYVSIVKQVGIVISVITIAIVILVLYFVINSSIIRKKHEIGIQKAIGFTTLQLMNQLSLGYILPILIGVIIGSVIGIYQTNPMMSVVQRSMGIMKASYIITPLWIALFGLGIILVSYLIAMWLTYRVRKISAYTLVTE